VTAVNLQYRVQTNVDGQPRVGEGAALDGSATRSTVIRGPVGPFGFARTSRNAAFMRIALNGSLAARANATTTLQGNWTETRLNEEGFGPPVETRSGTCGGQGSGRVDLAGLFRRRRGGVYAFFLVVPRQLPVAGPCPVDERGSDPSTVAAVRTVSPGAGTRIMRFNYRRSRRYNEDGAVVDEVHSLTGTIAIRRVKLCIFRRGFNQYGCAGYNPDSLG